MAKRKSKASGGDLKVVVHRPALTFIWRVLLIVVCLALIGTGIWSLVSGARLESFGHMSVLAWLALAAFSLRWFTYALWRLFGKKMYRQGGGQE